MLAGASMWDPATRVCGFLTPGETKELHDEVKKDLYLQVATTVNVERLAGVVELQRVRDQRMARVAEVNAQEAPVDRERPAMDLLDDSGRICLFYFCLSLFPNARCCRAPLLRRRQIRT